MITLNGSIHLFCDTDRGGNREDRYNNYGNRGGSHHQNRGGAGSGSGNGGGGGGNGSGGPGSTASGSSFEERRTSESMSQLSLEGNFSNAKLKLLNLI